MERAELGVCRAACRVPGVRPDPAAVLVVVHAEAAEAAGKQPDTGIRCSPGPPRGDLAAGQRAPLGDVLPDLGRLVEPGLPVAAGVADPQEPRGRYRRCRAPVPERLAALDTADERSGAGIGCFPSDQGVLPDQRPPLAGHRTLLPCV